MKTLAIVFLLFSSAAGALAQLAKDPSFEHPAEVLWKAALRAEESGKIEAARVTLWTLALVYYQSPEAAQAKSELFTLSIFQEAEEDRKAGKNKAAFVMFRAVREKFPESPLAKAAEAAAKLLEPAR